jgi:hypothetical protein
MVVDGSIYNKPTPWYYRKVVREYAVTSAFTAGFFGISYYFLQNRLSLPVIVLVAGVPCFIAGTIADLAVDATVFHEKGLG